MSRLDSAGISVEYRHLFHDDQRHHESLVMEQSKDEILLNKLAEQDIATTTASSSTSGTTSGTTVGGEGSGGRGGGGSGKSTGRGRGKTKKTVTTAGILQGTGGNPTATTDFFLGIIREQVLLSDTTIDPDSLSEAQLLDTFANASPEEKANVMKQMNAAMKRDRNNTPEGDGDNPPEGDSTMSPTGGNGVGKHPLPTKTNRELYMEEKAREEKESVIIMPDWWVSFYNESLPSDGPYLGDIAPLQEEYLKYQRVRKLANKAKAGSEDGEGSDMNAAAAAAAVVVVKKRKYTRRNSPTSDIDHHQTEDDTNTNTNDHDHDHDRRRLEGESLQAYENRLILQSTRQRLINPLINQDLALLFDYHKYLPRKAIATKETARRMEQYVVQHPEYYSEEEDKIEMEKEILDKKYDEKLHGEKMKRYAQQQLPYDDDTIMADYPPPRRILPPPEANNDQEVAATPTATVGTGVKTAVMKQSFPQPFARGRTTTTTAAAAATTAKVGSKKMTGTAGRGSVSTKIVNDDDDMMMIDGYDDSLISSDDVDIDDSLFADLADLDDLKPAATTVAPPPPPAKITKAKHGKKTTKSSTTSSSSSASSTAGGKKGGIKSSSSSIANDDEDDDFANLFGDDE